MGKGPGIAEDARKARLAEELKANLRRRKVQARSRREAGDDDGTGEAPSKTSEKKQDDRGDS